MNKRERVQEMLLEWREVFFKNLKQRFDKKETTDKIYHDLLYRDVPHAERQADMSVDPSLNHSSYSKDSKTNSPYAAPGCAFNNWINYYANSNNTDVFIDNYLRSFCQFVSKDGRAKKAREHISVQIPLDRKHLEDGATLIFDFLDKNGISHKSKISKRVRNDDIVVKLINPDDVSKLIDFVSNNKYLQEGLLPANPYAFQKNGLALTVEGKLSYNNVVSELIGLFIEHYKPMFEFIGEEDFYKYIESLYNNYFVKQDTSVDEYQTLKQFFKKRLREYRKTHNGRLTDQNKKDLIENYHQIIKLIIKSHYKDFTFEDLVDHYAESAHLPKVNDITKQEIDETIIQALTSLSAKYDIQTSIASVRNYYIYGEDEIVAKENNVASKLGKDYFRPTLNAILNSLHVDFDTYVNMVLEQYQVSLVEILPSKGK